MTTACPTCGTLDGIVEDNCVHGRSMCDECTHQCPDPFHAAPAPTDAMAEAWVKRLINDIEAAVINERKDEFQRAGHRFRAKRGANQGRASWLK